MTYKAKQNSIVDQDGKQIAVVVPVSCSMKVARVMAAYAAQQMNHEARWQAIEAQQQAIEASHGIGTDQSGEGAK